jgi:tight adherence protein B
MSATTLAVTVTGAAGAAVLVRLARRAEAVGRVERAATPARRAGAGPRTIVGARLEPHLRAAGVDLAPADALRLWLGGACAAAWFALALSPLLVVPSVVAVLAAGPLLLRARSRRVERTAVAALPELLEHVAGELRSGGTVVVALHRLAESSLPLARDMGRVRDRIGLGADVVDALAIWTRERPSPATTAVAGALVTAHGLGGGAAAALDGLAASLRDEQAARAEARALSAQARMSAWVVSLAPVGYLAVSALVAPDSLTVLVASAYGRICLVLGIGLLGTAGLVFRRMLAEEA